jgi:glycosyltransferase involved in cell wall biosynthesis
MNHPPNADGIAWFVREVWPQTPDARLLVVGRDPPESVLRLASDRIAVTGAVPDVAPYFARATAVIVPLLSGGGTRLKILEAFAAGRAVVSTSIGAEGLEVSDGRHLLLADGAHAFAEATGRLLADPELRARLAAEARKLVQERYDWRALGDRLEETLRRAAERA